MAWDTYLSYSRITNEEKFEEGIVVVGHFRLGALVVVVVVKQAKIARSRMTMDPFRAPVVDRPESHRHLE